MNSSPLEVQAKSLYVTVEGEQVLTADFVFQQMQASNARIDRARNIAIVSLVISVVAAAAISLILLLR